MELRIGAAIKKLRTSKNITQEQLADHLHVSFQAVSKWETGVTTPDVHLLPKLAVYFGVSIDDIFAVDDAEKLERIMKDFDEPVTEESFAFARKTLKEMLASDDNNYQALNAMAWVYNSYANKHSRIAVDYAKRAIKINPLNKGTYNAYNVLINALGIKYGGYHSRSSGPLDMLAFCEAYALKYPELESLNWWLAGICIDLKDYKRAESFIANMPPAQRPLMYGDIALARGSETEAYALWTNVKESEDFYAYYGAGDRFESCGMYEEAIRFFKASFEFTHSPRDLSSTYSLAFLYTRLGRYAEAILMWERIIDVMASDYGVTSGEHVSWPHNEIKKLQEKMTDIVNYSN